MRDEFTGTCEHCAKSFGYLLFHCGFGDCSYAYCNKCGMTAILSLWDKRFPKLALPAGWVQQEIPAELEQFFETLRVWRSFQAGCIPSLSTMLAGVISGNRDHLHRDECARNEEGLEVAAKLERPVLHRNRGQASGK